MISTFSDKQINELKKLFRDELGLEVSTKDACFHATQLINLLRATYKDTIDYSDIPP